MIKKLRKKFILINMSLVSLVLVIVFAAICLTNYQRLQTQGRDALQRAIFQKADMSPPKMEIDRHRDQEPFPLLPIFCITLDQNENILRITQENITVSNDIMEEATEKVLASGKMEGILYDLNLRFLKQDTPEGTKIAFADMTNDNSSMNSLVISLLLVGLGGLAAFFLISLFLSGWALKPVEKAWQQQRQFAADASHELKTPLTVILANTGILLSHRQDTVGHQIKWVENTQTEAIRMKKLVDDLLFLAKSDDARLSVEWSQLNFSDTVLGCLLPFESVAYEHGINISSRVDPEIQIRGDEGQLRQLLFILLDNACKYTGEKGTITVTLTHGQDKAFLSVHNTGAAILPDDLAHVFDRFYRADKSRFRQQGGYGLGLSIAKSIVENHHGKITAESSEHEGTTFSVYLPINQ